MLRTAHLFHPASTPTSRSTPGASLPRTLASPRTGLAPAGCRELVARLRHEVVSFLTAPKLLDAQLDFSSNVLIAGVALFDSAGFGFESRGAHSLGLPIYFPLKKSP